jgi:hypothetical protein
MADAQRIAELVREHAVSTNVDPTLQDWWSVVGDVLSRLGLDANSIVPFLEVLRPYVLVIVPIVLAVVLFRLLWNARRGERRARPEVVRETIVPANDVRAALLTLDELLALTDMRKALGLLWRQLAHRVASSGHGQWRTDSTPGEFYRSLDPDFAGRETWRDFTRSVEVGLYGAEVPTADAVRGWWERSASWR